VAHALCGIDVWDIRAKRESTGWEGEVCICMDGCENHRKKDVLSTTLIIPHSPPPMSDPGDELCSKSESVTKSL